MFLTAFSICLAAVLVATYAIGWIAQRNVHDVEDYVVAGRRLPLSLTTITIVATWFGAESLMTTTDEVAHLGWRRALMDPIGISLCLVIAGLFVAGPIWRMNILTIPDFFRIRYGKLAETIASLVLVPSYFGWIAAQYVALATLLSQIYGLSVEQWIVIVAIAGTGYSLMGGMCSITWTDTLQLILILLGLIVVGYGVLITLGTGSLIQGMQRVRYETPAPFWRLADQATYTRDMLAALSALTIGALGNLPVQDLMQRILSARSAATARWACFLGAIGYLAMGLISVLAGLSAALLLTEVPEEGVLTTLSEQILSPAFQIIFLLAIVSAVLSTIVSAVMAPASVLAHNVIEPLITRTMRSGAKREAHLDTDAVEKAAPQKDTVDTRVAREEITSELSTSAALWLVRLSVLGITAASILLALSGQGAYELVQSAYAISLVAMCVPFLAGIYFTIPPAAANGSMLAGILSWFLHSLAGVEFFLGTTGEHYLPVPHELGDTLLSLLALLFISFICSFKKK